MHVLMDDEHAGAFAFHGVVVGEVAFECGVTLLVFDGFKSHLRARE